MPPRPPRQRGNRPLRPGAGQTASNACAILDRRSPGADRFLHRSNEGVPCDRSATHRAHVSVLTAARFAAMRGMAGLKPRDRSGAAKASRCWSRNRTAWPPAICGSRSSPERSGCHAASRERDRSDAGKPETLVPGGETCIRRGSCPILSLALRTTWPCHDAFHRGACWRSASSSAAEAGSPRGSGLTPSHRRAIRRRGPTD